MEKERGISITSTAMQFEYQGFQINLLDTPGHADFSEDTYRTLAAADNGLMLIDAAKGLEPQTRKLFAVCRLNGLPGARPSSPPAPPPPTLSEHRALARSHGRWVHERAATVRQTSHLHRKRLESIPHRARVRAKVRVRVRVGSGNPGNGALLTLRSQRRF